MYKKYALITGASEGLGKFLAIECAKRQMNLVLVALPGSGLHCLENYLTKTFHVNVLCVETDLSEEGNCNRLFERVQSKKISISVLINNAGMGGTFSFGERNGTYYSKLISLNVTAPTLLCRLFLDDLKKNAPSYIMNVGSLAGMFDFAKKQVYGGTKSYLLSFSRSLRRDLKKDGVTVSILSPGGMNTSWRLTMENRMMNTWISRQSIMEPSDVAAIGIRKMFQGQELIITGFWNRFLLFLNRVFPKRIKEELMNYQAARWRQKELLVPALQHHFITPK